MTPQELEELKQDLKAVRMAIRRQNPLFKEIAAGNFLSKLSLPYGLFALAFGLGTQFLLDESGNLAALPRWWWPLFWSFLVLILGVGGALKILHFRRRAREARVPAGVWGIFLSVWGNDWFHINLSAAFVVLGVSAFAVYSGHPWYLLAAAIIYFGSALIGLGFVIRRPEYFASGWFGSVAGVLSLFDLERAPWLWLGVLLGGILLVFGLVGVLPSKPRPEGGED